MYRSMLAAIAVVGLATGFARATEEREFGPFRAKTVEVTGFAGELTIVPVAGEDIRLRLAGSEDDLRDFQVTADGDRLRLRGPRRRDSSSTVVIGNVTVFSSGGTASAVIGGQPHGRQEPPPRLEIRVPAGTALELSDLIGDLQIGDTGGALKLALVSGTARIGRITAAQIVLRGSGDVRVASVRERLEVSIDGSGLVDVGAGQVDDLVLDIRGAGDIRFGGSARRARAGISGAGTITVYEVFETPAVSVAGAGTVNIERRP